MAKFKVFLHYLRYWLIFVAIFSLMFVLFLITAVGIPFGVMMTIFGAAALMFNEELIITELAPPFMLFGGLAMICFSVACGLVAVKLGYFVSRRFIRTKRHCDRLRNW